MHGRRSMVLELPDLSIAASRIWMMIALDCWFRTLLSCALSMASAGCAEGSDRLEPSTKPAEQQEAPSRPRIVRWVGEVEDSDVRVAILVGPGKARLFFCGGAESYATTTRWFNLGFDGGEHIDFDEDTWRVHAHIAGGNVAGEVELGDDVTRWFTAEPIAPGTIAGLYEGKSDCGTIGLIVSQASSDSPPTAQGACSGLSVTPVTAVAPIRADGGKIAVQTPDALLLEAATLEPL
jgi:hypothetical protein